MRFDLCWKNNRRCDCIDSFEPHFHLFDRFGSCPCNFSVLQCCSWSISSLPLPFDDKVYVLLSACLFYETILLQKKSRASNRSFALFFTGCSTNIMEPSLRLFLGPAMQSLRVTCNSRRFRSEAEAVHHQDESDDNKDGIFCNNVK